MKRNSITLFAPLLAAVLVFAGCNKKEGCTDEDAANYDSEVKEKNDDGSCTYEGEYSLWFDQSWADYYSAEFPISVHDEEGNELISFDSTDYRTSEPECGASDYSFTYNLGTSKSKDIDLDIRDSEGNSFYIYSITIEAGDCGWARL